MKKLLTIIFILLAFTLNAQVIDTDPSFENKIVRKYKFKKFVNKVYKDVFKYATVLCSWRYW